MEAMHPVIHVAISILIGLAVNIHHKYRYTIIVSVAFLVNGIIDVDYIFYMRGIFTHRYFSSGIVMLYIPLLILLVAHIYERERNKSILTRISLLVLLVSASHLVLDTFSPDDVVYLYYPFSMAEYHLDQALIPYVTLMFIIAVFVVNRLEFYLYRNNEGRKRTKLHVKIAFILKDYSERFDDIRRSLDKGRGKKP